MVVVTHELASAFLIADRMILIDRGNIAAMGPVEEVKNSRHPRVRQFLDRIADTTRTMTWTISACSRKDSGEDHGSESRADSGRGCLF
jgi:ABC-type transporter Mla maintaining outer membrane lipid asymmetry ATPase subunit MlaF